MAKDPKRTVQFTLEKKLKQSQEIYNDRRFLNKLAARAADTIRTRTQLGKSAEKSGKSGRLAKLTPNYIEQRKKFSGGLSGKTRPGRSNLTATGQMLEALFGIYNSARRALEIDVKDERGSDFRGKPSEVTNRELIDYNEKGLRRNGAIKNPRRFFDLTDSELNGISRVIRDRIRELLEK